MKYTVFSAIAVFFLFAAAGCSTDAPQPEKETVSKRLANKNAKSKNKQKKAVKATASEKGGKTEKEYSYTAAGKPDPFRPLLAEAPVKIKVPEKDRAFLTPLQKYELSELKLVAVVVIDNTPTAMLEDPTGYGYVIRKGALVGPNDGVVERVTPAGLLIKEKFLNEAGETESKVSTITIQQDE